MIRTSVLAGVALLAFSAGGAGADLRALQGIRGFKFEIGLLLRATPPLHRRKRRSMPATMAGPEPSDRVLQVDRLDRADRSERAPIRFQLNLPAQWNGRSVQYGGGGFNGVLITGLAQLRDAPADLPPPVALGFMTVRHRFRSRQRQAEGDSGIRAE